MDCVVEIHSQFIKNLSQIKKKIEIYLKFYGMESRQLYNKPMAINIQSLFSIAHTF